MNEPLSSPSVRGDILIVDDTPANLQLLTEMLKEQGYKVRPVPNGRLALKAAENNPPDLILLDIMMPGIDGFETCQRLKANEKTQEIPVIFMTALSDTVNKVKGFELGAVDYITKPVEPEEVLARVKAHLTIQQLRQDLQTRNEELRGSLEREKELNKLKSRFISMASHELRTPLTTVTLSIDLLERYGNRMSDDKRTEEFETMKNTIERMTDLLNEVLMVSKAEAGKFEFRPESVNLINVCQGIVQQFKGISEETHTIEFSTIGEQFQTSADPKLLRHILSNLLSNAIKYSPVGGTVYFELAREPKEIMFRVKDEGIGISKKDQEHLFDAFHRGANVGKIKGTGLGLSIVKQFVELHGGTINVESTVNQGTTFTVILPIRDYD